MNIFSWRLGINVAILIVTLILIIMALGMIGNTLEFPYHDLIMKIIAWIIWAMFAESFIDKTLLSVPFQRAIVTMNEFTGTQKVWRTGYNVIYAWEKEERVVEVIKHIMIEEKGKVGESETYTSKDHTLLYAKWTQLIQPNEDALETFIKFKESDIEKAFRAFTNEKLSDMCAKEDAPVLMAKKAKLAEDLALAYGGESGLSDMEKKYGVKTLDPILSDVDQDPEVLKKRQAGIETEALTRAAGNAASHIITKALEAKKALIAIGSPEALEEARDMKIPTMAEALEFVLLSQKDSKIQKQVYKGLEGAIHVALGGLPMMGSPRSDESKKGSDTGGKKK